MAEGLLECLRGTLPLGKKLEAINRISKQLTLSQVDEILEVLETNADYNRLRLKLADDFKRPSCVLNILKHDDKSSISRAVELPWMYAEGSVLVNAGFLVELFLQISFSTRRKIIHNLGIHLRNPQTANDIFNLIEYKYGFAVASAMLPACSGEVLINLLLDKRHELSPVQLLTVVKASPQTGLNYLKTLFSMTTDYKSDYSSSIKYLLYHHLSETLGLMFEYPDRWNCTLGRKMSRRILRLKGIGVMKLVNKNRYSFKLCQLQKFLSPHQYEQAFLKSESEAQGMLKGDFGATIWVWLDHLPKHRQLDLLRKCFRVGFNKDIIECPQHVTPDMLALLPLEDKCAIIDWKIENGCKFHTHCRSLDFYPSVYNTNFEWFWRSLKPTKDSIPELTKILYSEKECSKRSELFRFLGMSCICNKDSQELIKVMQLLTKRCRNDQAEIRQALLQVMEKASRHMEFEEEHWACFQELLQFLQLYEEVNKNSCLVLALLAKYAAYHQNQGNSFDAELNLIVEITANSRVAYDFSDIEEPESQRGLLESYVKASACEEQFGTQSVSDHYVIGLMQSILKWNRHHQKKLGSINGCSWLVKKCEEIVTNEDSCDYNRITAFMILNKNFILKSEIFDELLSSQICIPILYYCLKLHPEKVAAHMGNIVSKILSQKNASDFLTFFTFVKKLKATYCWTLLNKIKDECKKVVNHGDPKSVVTEMGNAVRLLSILEPSDFLNLASNYYPIEAKIDPSIPIDTLDYKMKESIAGSLKHLHNPGSLLHVIDRFLVGDYLKLALGSLYSACAAAPEIQALAYLESQIKSRPVSVKKHMIRLFFMISPLNRKFKILEDRWLSEKNPSIRYEILVQIYHLFESKPTKEVWKLLKSSVASLTDVDSPSIDFVNTSSSIDDRLGEFVSDFVQTILETFKRIGVYKKFEGNIIYRISNRISMYNGNFLDSLIQGLLSKPQLATEGMYSHLAIKYLMDESIRPQIRTHRLNLLQKIFQDLFDHQWDVTEFDHNEEKSPIYPTRRLLSCIAKGICDTLLNCRGKDKFGKAILHELIIQFAKVPDISITFDDVVYMKLTLIALEIESEDNAWLRTFGQHVAFFLSYHAEKYGGEIIFVISVILREIFNRIRAVVNDESILEIINGLLSDENDKCHLITAISLLPRSHPKSPELSLMYKRIIDTIKRSSDPVVQIYLNIRETNGQMQFFNT